MALLSGDGGIFLLRWIHMLAGITWVGMLYYFNFVQTPFFAETDPAVRSGVLQRLVPRALWWFRWAAMATFFSGLLYLGHRLGHGGGGALAASSPILLGGLMGTIMWANVWFVIWPRQRILVQNAIDTAAGKATNPAAAPANARSGLASRTNTALSIPMLFFMAASSHLALPVPRSGATFWAGALAILALVEINALMGRPGQGAARPLATVKGALWLGFVLALLFYAWFEITR